MRRALALLTALAALAACSSPPAEERPGNPQVYERITSTEDCALLQREFDTAAENNERSEPGTGQYEGTLDYMKAADERMRQVGCY